MLNEDIIKKSAHDSSFQNIKRLSELRDIKSSNKGNFFFEIGSTPHTYPFIVDWQMFEAEYKYRSESPPVQ